MKKYTTKNVEIEITISDIIKIINDALKQYKVLEDPVEIKSKFNKMMDYEKEGYFKEIVGELRSTLRDIKSKCLYIENINKLENIKEPER
ncbi:MAG: hypothetical protein AABY22_19390 [Nanoarchaeota archaeon]